MSKPQPYLSVDLNHHLGALRIRITFELTQPWTVLFGPSGSGKSTILRAIAGLIRPDDARVVLRRKNHEEQIAVDSARKIFVPPHRRFVRWTAQRPALFPNRTVRGNLQLAANASQLKNEAAVENALNRFQLVSLANRKPQALSGGEQQRVSLARAALGAEGRLLLLDEPFSGLDTPLRDDLLAVLRDWLSSEETPVLSVTHDVGEAFLIDAEVIRLDQGQILAQGPVTEVLKEERSRLLAQLGYTQADLSN